MQSKHFIGEGDAGLLTEAALDFVAELHRRFDSRRIELLDARKRRQKLIEAGYYPDFLPETAHIRNGDWKIKGTPPDLWDRRVEITGPVDRKMVINALNAGANVFMADFEDSNSPTRDNVVQGQRNLFDAVRRQIEYRSPEGKEYRLNEKTAVLMVRPRGWALPEKHFVYDGKPGSGALFDFGLFFFHNAKELLARGSGPYFYLPKLESHLEARLWNDVFLFAQEALGLPVGTIKATVLIETILAAFEMDEILYELRDHVTGLNCGRWDYIFSIVKKFRHDPLRLLPDRAAVTMTTPCMRSYSLLLIKTCHKRGAHAMGGMAAQIPIKNDPAANEAALAKVRADKEREAADGHDGTWVAHPGLVAVAKEIFDRLMPQPNQIHVTRDDVQVATEDLLRVPEGKITELGVRLNVDVGLQYTAAWLTGSGCVPIYNLMEDAATAEISRSQLWQWVRHNARLEDGRNLSTELFNRIFEEELEKHRTRLGDEFYSAGYPKAAEILKKLVLQEEFAEFLTLPAYEML